MSRHLTGSLLIVLAVLGLLAPAAGASVVGPNINVTQALGSQREGAIAINPANPQQMFTVAADAVNKDLITARSSDGGATLDPRDGRLRERHRAGQRRPAGLVLQPQCGLRPLRQPLHHLPRAGAVDVRDLRLQHRRRSELQRPDRGRSPR